MFINNDGTNKLPATWTPPAGSGWSSAVLPYDSNMAQTFPTGSSGNGTMACLWELLDRAGGAKPNPNFVYP